MVFWDREKKNYGRGRCKGNKDQLENGQRNDGSSTINERCLIGKISRDAALGKTSAKLGGEERGGEGIEEGKRWSLKKRRKRLCAP